jgi:3-hydroxyisobutyrate dehydrogenase
MTFAKAQEAEPVARVGFVGLGNMGRPMARNLAAAGFRLTVRDAEGERQERFAAEHACEAAATPAAFGASDVVVTMLPDDRVVREVMLGWEGGIASALRAGAVVVDMSSSNPTRTQELGRELAEKGVSLVDAPVSGGVPRAETATLAIMVGGDDEQAFSRAEQVLRALGDRLFRTGRLGSGHAMKALNNYVAAAAYASAAESLAVGQRFGLEPATMVEILNASTGRSFSTELVFKEHVVSGSYATGFALGLLAKDVGIADDLAAATGIEAPLCRLVERRWSEALAGLGPAADHSEAHRSWWPFEFAGQGSDAAAAPRRAG